MNFTTILFDLDGTLLDTLPDLADAANAMRQELGLPLLAPALIGTYVGKGAGVLVARTLSGPDEAPVSDEQMQQGLAAFKRHYHAVNGRRAAAYPGALEGLAQFRDMGLQLGIVTNKPAAFTAPLLEQAGIAGFFRCVVSGDTCARAKPDPMPILHACAELGADPARTVMIGDSVNDALAGRAAGATVLAVPYGYNEGHDVQTLEVDAIVSSIADAAQWVAQRQIQDTP